MALHVERDRDNSRHVAISLFLIYLVSMLTKSTFLIAIVVSCIASFRSLFSQQSQHSPQVQVNPGASRNLFLRVSGRSRGPLRGILDSLTGTFHHNNTSTAFENGPLKLTLTRPEMPLEEIIYPKKASGHQLV